MSKKDIEVGVETDGQQRDTCYTMFRGVLTNPAKRFAVGVIGSFLLATSASAVMYASDAVFSTDVVDQIDAGSIDALNILLWTIAKVSDPDAVLADRASSQQAVRMLLEYPGISALTGAVVELALETTAAIAIGCARACRN